MSDVRSPVAVRVSRPHASEDALLEHEAETISRGSIVLLDAPSKPDGVVLRFELTLSDGTVAIRGEGRVTGMKTTRLGTGLALRFTRLDVKSKQLVDRAVALRESKRLPGTTPSVTDFIAVTGEFRVADRPSGPLPPEPLSDRHAFAAAAEDSPMSAPGSVGYAVDDPPSTREAPISTPRSASEPLGADAVARALERLRERATLLTPAEIEQMIASGKKARQSSGP